MARVEDEGQLNTMFCLKGNPDIGLMTQKEDKTEKKCLFANRWQLVGIARLIQRG